MISFPQELFDAIIDEVHDTSSLKACALVATTFTTPCQRNIFRALYIYRKSSSGSQPGRGPSLKDAAVLFTASPHLGAYVRDLTVEMPDTVPKLDAWNVVLRSVQNIERLVVSGKPVTITLHGAFSALLDSLALPSLGRLHLVNTRRIPSALLLAATSVPVVSFYRVTVDPREDPQISSQLHSLPSATRLRHLILTDAGTAVLPTYEFLLHPRDSPYTSHIERLEVRMDPHSRGFDQRILAACAATMKYLVIDPGGISFP